jgi:Spy/CpxP family protein refolding chaperone
MKEHRMNRFRNVALVTILGGALVSGAAFAQGPAQGPDGRRGGPGGPGFGRGGAVFGRDAGLPLGALNLTEQQQEQVRALRELYRAQDPPLQPRLEADIQALLTPEQQAAAQKLPAEREARRPQRQQ